MQVLKNFQEKLRYKNYSLKILFGSPNLLSYITDIEIKVLKNFQEKVR